MKRLNRFILKSFIGPFFMTLFITLFLLLMQFLWKYIDDLVGKGLEVSVIAELLFYATITLVPMALPLSMLLSSIMTFGNLGEFNELMAIKSSGVSLVRIMKPLIFLTLFICGGAFFFSNNVMPYANLKMGSLLYDVRKQSPEVSIKAGVFNNGLEGFSLKISRKNKKTGMMYDLMIYDHTEKNGNRKVTLADSATLNITSNNNYMILNMYHGVSYNEVVEKDKRRSEKEYPHRLDYFDEQRVLIDMSGLGFERTDESLFKSHYQMLNLDQLTYSIDSLNGVLDEQVDYFDNRLVRDSYWKYAKPQSADSIWLNNTQVPDSVFNIDSLMAGYKSFTKRKIYSRALDEVRDTKSDIQSFATSHINRGKWIKRHEIEWHRKFTLAFACLILFFIGAPFGAIIRKGGLGTPVVVSVVFFIIYYVISITGEKSAKIGTWSSWFGMWLSAMVLFPLGIFLTYKAVNDSVLLNTNTYIAYIKKVFSFKKHFNTIKSKVFKRGEKG